LLLGLVDDEQLVLSILFNILFEEKRHALLFSMQLVA